MRFKMKTCHYFVALILLFGVFCIVRSDDDKKDDDNAEEFIPTNEWQVIKPGQKVPRGLHVRMNFDTGVTEAKLVDYKDEDEFNENQETSKKQEQKSDVAITHQENNPEQDEDEDEELLEEEQAIDHETLTNLHKQIKNTLKRMKVDNPPENIAKSMFRSYAALQKDFEDLKLKPTSEVDIIAELLGKHEEEIARKPTDEILINAILLDLEFLVHQYDNALDFVKMEGLEKVVYKNMNSTNIKRKLSALKLFSSCLQNNLKTQAYALESGGLIKLMRMLSTESNLHIRTRAIFPLGALIRRFPAAQKRFIDNGGVALFSKLLETPNTDLHVKIATLLYDLIMEHAEAQIALENPQYKARLKMYDDVNIKRKMIAAGYCTSLTEVLTILDKTDFDALERVILTLDLLVPECEIGEFMYNLNDVVHDLLRRVVNMPLEEQVILEGYMKNLKTLYRTVSNRLHPPQQVKSEL